MRKTILSALLTLCASAAHCEVLQFEFTGTVTYSTYLAPVGSPVVGTFAYDPHLQPVIRELPFLAAYRPAEPITLSVGAHHVVSESVAVDIHDNSLRSNAPDAIAITGIQPVLDGTTYAQGSLGLGLTTTWGDHFALDGPRLPRSFDVSQFTGGAMGQLRSSGVDGGVLLEFRVDAIRVISP